MFLPERRTGGKPGVKTRGARVTLDMLGYAIRTLELLCMITTKRRRVDFRGADYMQRYRANVEDGRPAASDYTKLHILHQRISEPEIPRDAFRFAWHNKGRSKTCSLKMYPKHLLPSHSDLNIKGRAVSRDCGRVQKMQDVLGSFQNAFVMYFVALKQVNTD